MPRLDVPWTAPVIGEIMAAIGFRFVPEDTSMTGQDQTARVIELGGVCVDCAQDQFEEMVGFYRDALGSEVIHHEKKWASLCDPRGTFINIQAQDWYEPPVWPEHQAVQTKMIHFECGVNDMEAAVELVVRSGGTIAPYQPYDRDRSQLLVVLDPAGHPMCLLAN